MFFKKSKDKSDNDDLTKVAALLIYAAKIDENYSQKEQEIIKKTLKNRKQLSLISILLLTP